MFFSGNNQSYQQASVDVDAIVADNTEGYNDHSCISEMIHNLVQSNLNNNNKINFKIYLCDDVISEGDHSQLYIDDGENALHLGIPDDKEAKIQNNILEDQEKNICRSKLELHQLNQDKSNTDETTCKEEIDMKIEEVKEKIYKAQLAVNNAKEKKDQAEAPWKNCKALTFGYSDRKGVGNRGFGLKAPIYKQGSPSVGLILSTIIKEDKTHKLTGVKFKLESPREAVSYMNLNSKSLEFFKESLPFLSDKPGVYYLIINGCMKDDDKHFSEFVTKMMKKVHTDELKAIDEDKSTELYALLTVSANRFLEKNSIRFNNHDLKYLDIHKPNNDLPERKMAVNASFESSGKLTIKMEDKDIIIVEADYLIKNSINSEIIYEETKNINENSKKTDLSSEDLLDNYQNNKKKQDLRSKCKPKKNKAKNNKFIVEFVMNDYTASDWNSVFVKNQDVMSVSEISKNKFSTLRGDYRKINVNIGEITIVSEDIPVTQHETGAIWPGLRFQCNINPNSPNSHLKNIINLSNVKENSTFNKKFKKCLKNLINRIQQFMWLYKRLVKQSVKKNLSVALKQPENLAHDTTTTSASKVPAGEEHDKEEIMAEVKAEAAENLIIPTGGSEYNHSYSNDEEERIQLPYTPVLTSPSKVEVSHGETQDFINAAVDSDDQVKQVEEVKEDLGETQSISQENISDDEEGRCSPSKSENLDGDTHISHINKFSDTDDKDAASTQEASDTNNLPDENNMNINSSTNTLNEDKLDTVTNELSNSHSYFRKHEASDSISIDSNDSEKNDKTVLPRNNFSREDKIYAKTEKQDNRDPITGVKLDLFQNYELIEYDHIDGNRSNNDPDNCWALTPISHRLKTKCPKIVKDLEDDDAKKCILAYLIWKSYEESVAEYIRKNSDNVEFNEKIRDSGINIDELISSLPSLKLKIPN